MCIKVNEKDRDTHSYNEKEADESRTGRFLKVIVNGQSSEMPSIKQGSHHGPNPFFFT